MRTKLTALLVLTGVTAGTTMWIYRPETSAVGALDAQRLALGAGTGRVGTLIPAVATPNAERRASSASKALRLTAVDPEGIPADPFRPIVGPPLPTRNYSSLRSVLTFQGPVLTNVGPPVSAQRAALSTLGPTSDGGQRNGGGDPAAIEGRAPASSRDDIQLRGIILGPPNVVLVCCEGQTYFVKEGERFAGSWEVRHIREHTAVLVNGDRVLELQIEGGS